MPAYRLEDCPAVEKKLPQPTSESLVRSGQLDIFAQSRKTDLNYLDMTPSQKRESPISLEVR